MMIHDDTGGYDAYICLYNDGQWWVNIGLIDVNSD